MRRFLFGLIVLAGISISGCSLWSDIASALNIADVNFSSGGVDTPTVSTPSSSTLAGLALQSALTGSTSSLSSSLLDSFALNITYRLKADNSGNAERATFGSSALRPVLHFYVGDTSKTPFEDTVPVFSIPAGKDTTIPFGVKIPFTWLKTNAPGMASQIINGSQIPYRLAGQLNFSIPSVTTSKTSEFNLTSGGIAAQSIASAATTILSKLLK